MMSSTISAATLAFSLVTASSVAAQPNVPYDGLKKTVSIDQFLATEAVGGTVTAEGMTALLTAALVRDGRFVVVERTGLVNILAEQALGQGAATTAETAAKTGQLFGASVVVRSAVTKYAPAASGGSVALGGFPLGSILSPFATRAGLTHQTSVMEISLRLIDTTTGQIISTASAQGSASSTAANVIVVDSSSGASLGGDAFRATPIGQAGEQAIVKAVEQIAIGMKGVPWSALVVDASADQVYINAGAERNMQAGIILSVHRKVRVFTDPATGVILDVDMQKIGKIRIDGVREKMSTAAVINGETPVRGDLLKLDPD